MEPVTVKKRKQKESMLLSLFEELFQQTKKPVYSALFADKMRDKYQHFYSESMVRAFSFRSMEKQKMIQRVYPKQGNSHLHLYAPIRISIPLEERDWETLQEREERRKAFLNQLPALSAEEYALFQSLVCTKNEKNQRVRMSLTKHAQQQTEEFSAFVALINPYLPFLHDKQRICIERRLGMDGEGFKGFEEVGKPLNIGHSQSLEYFTNGLFQLGKLVDEKYVPLNK